MKPEVDSPSVPPLGKRRLTRWLLLGLGATLLMGTLLSAARLVWSLGQPPPPNVHSMSPSPDLFPTQPPPPNLRSASPTPNLTPMPLPSLGIPKGADWPATGVPSAGVAGAGVAGVEGPSVTFEPTIDAAASAESRLSLHALNRHSSLELIGKIPASLAVCLDTHTGLILASTRGGMLHWVNAATCELHGSCRLDLPAYHLVIDPKRRILYTASSTPDALSVNRLGDRDQASGEVCAYDLNAILKGNRSEPVRPSKRLSINAHLTALLLSANGEELYYLCETTRDTQLGRVATQKWTMDKPLRQPSNGPTALVPAPDEPILYALTASRIYTIDIRSWKVINRIGLAGPIHGLLVGKNRRVYLLEWRFGIQVQVIDLPTRKQLARWHLEADGRPYFRLSPDTRQLFVATSAVTTGRILMLDVSNPQNTQPIVKGHVSGDRQHLLRGGFFVTEDGRYVVSGAGVVFRVRS
jgi:hypothetical protein